MDSDLARSLLAGWISGALAGLVTTGLLLVLAARRPGFIARLPVKRLPALGMVLANALTFAFTLIGLILGALFHRNGAEEGALRFALFVAGGTLVLSALYLFVRGRIRTAEAPAVFIVLVVAGIAFGGVLPWLGSIGA